MISRNNTLEQIKNNFDSHGIKKGDILYYARILPSCDIYEILELKIRTVYPTFFCGVDKDTQQAFLFGYSNMNKTVFANRQMALNIIKDAELLQD